VRRSNTQHHMSAECQKNKTEYKAPYQYLITSASFARCTLDCAGWRQKTLNGFYLSASRTGSSSSTPRSRSRSRPRINLHTTASPSPHSTLYTNHIAIMGNGAKAASKRERNAKDAGSVAKSQLKSVRFFFLLSRKRRACPRSSSKKKGNGVPCSVH
jgi:hypothetical protein